MGCQPFAYVVSGIDELAMALRYAGMSSRRTADFTFCWSSLYTATPLRRRGHGLFTHVAPIGVIVRG